MFGVLSSPPKVRLIGSRKDIFEMGVGESSGSLYVFDGIDTRWVSELKREWKQISIHGDLVKASLY